VVDENEVITEESTSPENRRIRVYNRDGDFIIDVPANAKITFGYFNPATPSEGAGQRGYGSPDNVARQTALRIYRTDKDQLACFIGVKGFRDMAIGITRLTQKVTVERRMTQDDEAVEWYGTETRQLTARSEDEYL
jgi:hypothetical protein